MIKEFVTVATADALNAAIAERGIDEAKIVSVLYVETNNGAGVGLVDRKFRVLYRDERSATLDGAQSARAAHVAPARTSA